MAGSSKVEHNSVKVEVAVRVCLCQPRKVSELVRTRS